jgi:hypothetical protein
MKMHSQKEVEDICSPFFRSIAAGNFHITITQAGSIAIIISKKSGGNKPVIGIYWSGEEWIPAKWDEFGKFIDSENPRGLDLILSDENQPKEYA